MEARRVITFGEIMLRLSSPGREKIIQSSSFDVTFGGGEANVAVSLANYGFESCFLSKIPDNDIGQAAVNHLRRFGVSDRFIVRGGTRLGIYFLESGASQRPSKVIYDRADSAVTTLTPEEIDLSAVFAGAKWFHWTGITPAIGGNAPKMLRSVLEAARRAGATISCDLNFRKKLWSTETAQATMRPLMEFVDVCICNEEDAQLTLGIDAPEVDVESGELDRARYEAILHQLKDQFGFSTVAITLRESYSASRNGWSAIMIDNTDCATPFVSSRYEIELVDRVGGGDAFASGLIAGLHLESDTRRALEFAVAASCLKQTIPGDFNLCSVDEVRRLVDGGGSGRIQR
ncbi:MAG: PfkB family carbohydrate kinase, partial [Rhodothermia bacterium]